ncbi:MAG: hypothetical protein EAZ42_00880 [Verrucomicrobia bacterium]|nr:MAG: hypothetical protein EAZ42_00880 [Verrucomicrobiota bacterium]
MKNYQIFSNNKQPYRWCCVAWICGVIACFALQPLHAQATQAPPEEAGDKKKEGKDEEIEGAFWQVKLPGGSFRVLLSKIVSVSRHKYLLDGMVTVDEVTIDTDGQALARFYHLTPIGEDSSLNTAAQLAQRARELAQQATNRADLSKSTQVIKKYPETTHAKSIEYMIDSKQELTRIFESVDKAWTEARGRRYSSPDLPKEEEDGKTENPTPQP